MIELIQENSRLKAKERLKKNAGLLLEACEEALKHLNNHALIDRQTEVRHELLTAKLESAIKKARESN